MDPMRPDSCRWEYNYEMQKGPYKSMYWIGVVGRVKRAQYVPFTVSSILSLPILDERYCRQYFDWVSIEH